MSRPPICLSQSRLRPLWLCPYNFVQSYGLSGENADYGADSSEDATVGTVLHALDAMYCSICWKQRRKSNWVLFDKLRDDALAKIPSHRRAKANDVADRIKETSILDLKADKALFERRFAIQWPSFNACKPGETVDRLEGTFDKLYFFGDRAVIRDSKMGWSRHAGQFEEDAFEDLQLMVYAFMVFNIWPEVRQVDGWLDFMAYGGNNTCGGSWTRETIETCEIEWYDGRRTIPSLLNDSFIRADILFTAHGSDMPAERFDGEKGHNDACRWCRLACPNWNIIKERNLG